MMSEEEVRGLLATLRRMDEMKIANTDSACGALYVVLEEGLPAKK